MNHKASQPDTWLSRHAEFVALANRFGRLSTREHRDRLACGAIAERCLKRYDRELNAAKLAEYLTHVNGKRTSRETLNDYRAAYKMYRLWKAQCGGEPPHLDISKLAQAHRSGPAHLSDDDKITLCERTADRELTRSRMRAEALRISKERTTAQLRYHLKPTINQVRQIDGLQLLRECEPESADVILLDWMYMPLAHRPEKPLPKVHTPTDPVGHIIDCVREARIRLTRYGIIALFTGHKSDPDCRLLSALRECGLTRTDQYISQTVVGNFSQAPGSVFTSAHETIDIYRRADVSDFPHRLACERSVSPRRQNRNHMTSSYPAVHPCEKSVELMKSLIRPVTVNGLVVDPFVGSGSSGIACAELKCSFKGAELVPEFVQLANKRIALATNREHQTEHAINDALDGANPEQRASIEHYLNQAGIELLEMEDAA